MPRVLALDIATHFGWAEDHLGVYGRPTWGSVSLPKEDGEFGRRACAFEDFLVERIQNTKPELIAFEQPQDPRNFRRWENDKGEMAPDRKPFWGTNFATMRLLIGMAFECERIAKRHGIECIEVPVQSWRSYFTGTQKGGKEPTIARCRQLRWFVSNDNCADALGLWAFVKAKTDPRWNPVPLPLEEAIR